MKKNLFKKYICFYLILFLFFPFAIAQSQQTIYVDQAPGDYTPAATFNLEDFLTGLALWVFYVVMALAIIFILIAAYYFLSAEGDPNKIAMARSRLIYALVGAAVAVLAWGLIRFMAVFLGGGSTSGAGTGLELLSLLMP